MKKGQGKSWTVKALEEFFNGFCNFESLMTKFEDLNFNDLNFNDLNLSNLNMNIFQPVQKVFHLSTQFTIFKFITFLFFTVLSFSKKLERSRPFTVQHQPKLQLFTVKVKVKTIKSFSEILP